MATAKSSGLAVENDASGRTMNVSVIICTYNRCDHLRRTLETFCGLKLPANVSWEVLLIDNNSNDRTREACENFGAKLPIRYIFEPRQGKSFALNHGIQEAKNDLLLF